MTSGTPCSSSAATAPSSKLGLAPDQLQDVDEIEKATDRAAELTVELFDLARRYAAE